ncbi:glycoside hydrolase family 3 protein [Collybia nuda]|uniref:beta-glucosidase n=1 Tax=Collybia nuda TaxID=64659 RepID=A0A9P5YFJ3_9AGAR|nr:glycoside hydrolase family 3 protein [Collybia nuda]
MVSQRFHKLALLSVVIWTLAPLASSIAPSAFSASASASISASRHESASASSHAALTSTPSGSSAQPPSSGISASSSGLGSTPASSSASASGTGTASGFVPFPPPSQAPIPGVFPVTSPQHPPSTGDSMQIIPDFAPAWAAAYKKAKAKIASFSLEELVSVTTGMQASGMVGRCVGNIPPIEPATGRGWAGLCLEDSPLGVRLADFVTSFPTGINTAATFNRSLIRTRGLFMGEEHKGKGVNVALGPMMNLARVAEGGRNFEGFGEDPFLAGEAAYETILGMQEGGVQACAKHFIDNEQEHARTTSSSNVDDRTQHEVYAHPFLRSVMAGVTSVMCSYNLINNTYACENDKTLNDVLKREFGFQGYVMSDWGGTHSTLSAAAGLDMTMPGNVGNGPGSFFGGNLTAFVQNQTISEDRVKDMATRIFAGWYFLNQDSSSYPAVNFNGNNQGDEATNEHIDVQDDHFKVVREIGAASTVLLKNERGALPLKRPRSILLAGSDAGPARTAGPNAFRNQGGNDGVLAMGGGSGTADLTYLISPYEALQRRAREDRTTVTWIFDDFNLARASSMAVGRSVALVFINSDSSEGSDRTNITAWHGGDDLVLAVAAQNNNTIVVVHSVGQLIVEPWIDHPNVTALLWAGAPGQEAGNSITDVLYGDWNPSGRLPYTIAKRLEDYSAQVVLGSGTATNPLPVPYDEQLLIGYRAFDARNITPRFEFGFGLSYTKFSYSNLRVEKLSSGNSDLEKNWDAGKSSPIAVGSSTAAWLHRPAFKVTFDVKNTGSVAGGEIPQLYLQMPASAEEPPSILKGFTDVQLRPGQQKSLEITLSRYSLSVWDIVDQGWKKPEGTIGVAVGASSRDFRLHGKIPA